MGVPSVVIENGCPDLELCNLTVEIPRGQALTAWRLECGCGYCRARARR
jgi:hypothetical protein